MKSNSIDLKRSFGITERNHRATAEPSAPSRTHLSRQVAWVLNCQVHDVPVLVASRLLRPLGNPQPNSVKYFATVDVVERSKDPARLAKMTNAVTYDDFSMRPALFGWLREAKSRKAI